MDRSKIFKSALLASLVATPTLAVADPSGFELGIGVNQFLFGDDIPLDNSTGYRLGAGYRFDNPWGIELSYNKTTADLEGASGDLDVEHYYLDVLYHFNLGNKVQPYLALGYGSADAEILDGESFDIGAGLKIYVNDSFSIRPDIHYADVDEFNDSHIITSLSLSWLFGGKSASAPAPAPKPAAPLDSDNDGVPNGQDNCPTSPAGSAVNSVGCPVDTDKDGVADVDDKCANTPMGTTVDATGCAAIEAPVSIELKVNFDSNSSVVKAEYLDEIQRVADFLKQYKNTDAVIEGHTDTSGSASYNKSLSQRRADAVAKVLVDQFGIDTSRVSAIGYGEERPIADESTREGMLANRRVIAEISTTAE